MRPFAKLLKRRSDRMFQRPSLDLLTLEDRAVPASVTVLPIGQTANNVTTFLNLGAAITAAGSGGTVTIEPGAASSQTSPITQSGITIQGDPNVPSSILPAFDLTVNANAVTLKNLNLTSVQINSGIQNVTITRSTIGSITTDGGTGSGFDTITQNSITGEVSLGVPGTAGTPGSTSDHVLNNTFAGFSLNMLLLEQDNGAIVQGNTFTGGGGVTTTGTPPTLITNAPQTAITIESSTTVNVSNNVIRLPGNTVAAGSTGVYTAIAIQASMTTTTTGGVSSGSILNNVLSTGTTGTGLSISSQATDTNPDANTKFLVQGNDFNNDAIGVNYIGSGGSTVGSDLGNGALMSLGGNNFRSFVAAATTTTGAIVASNLGNGAVLKAQANIFGIGVGPSTVVFVPQPTGGTATIDVGSPLTNNQAFVQTLYNSFLGRTGALTELNGWVSVLTGTGTNTGQMAVAQGIAGSDAALTLIINAYYLKYLGRVSDSGGVQFWLSQIHAGTSLENVQAGFASSQEFISANNSDYVQGLYRTFFNRTGSSSELAFWYGQIQQPNGLNIVSQGFANSQENKMLFISNFFTSYLHRPASASDITFWSTQGSFFNIAIGILSSPAYFMFG
jgi:hypothetical protein